MAAAFRFWGKKGFVEGSAGHISSRDSIKKDCFWLNPYGLHFSSVQAGDLVLVSLDGTIQPEGAQRRINTAGFFIHAEIHKARPDIHSAAHCHSPYGRAWSTFGKPIDILNQDACVYYNNLSVYSNFNGVVNSNEEGRRIAQALGPKNRNVILQNHGLLTLGTTVDEAAYSLSLLENICQAQLLVEAAEKKGLMKSVVSEEDAAFTAEIVNTPDSLYSDFQVEYGLLERETKGDFKL